MADRRCPGRLEPIDIADTPGMDRIASSSYAGEFESTPEGFSPGSDVAILTILSCPAENIPAGRAALEALGEGIMLGDDDTAYRCSFIRRGTQSCVDDGYLSGCDPEIREEILKKAAEAGLRFEGGCGKLIAIMGKGPLTPSDSPYSEGERSCVPDFAEDINGMLRDRGESVEMRLWSASRPVAFRPFPVRAAAVAAVPLVKGIARSMGMDVVEVAGATGRCDTDYSAKAAAAVKALESHDFVLLHVEACDEASHRRSFSDKVKAIEEIDKKILRPLAALENVRLTVMADHPTYWDSGCHGSDNVKFIIHGSIDLSGQPLRPLRGDELIKILLNSGELSNFA